MSNPQEVQKPKKGPTAQLKEACIAGSLAKVKELVRNGINFTRYQRDESTICLTALEAACKYGHVAIVRYLIEEATKEREAADFPKLKRPLDPLFADGAVLRRAFDTRNLGIIQYYLCHVNEAASLDVLGRCLLGLCFTDQKQLTPRRIRRFIAMLSTDIFGVDQSETALNLQAVEQIIEQCVAGQCQTTALLRLLESVAVADAERAQFLLSPACRKAASVGVVATAEDLRKLVTQQLSPSRQTKL